MYHNINAINKKINLYTHAIEVLKILPTDKLITRAQFKRLTNYDLTKMRFEPEQEEELVIEVPAPRSFYTSNYGAYFDKDDVKEYYIKQKIRRAFGPCYIRKPDAPQDLKIRLHTVRYHYNVADLITDLTLSLNTQKEMREEWQRWATEKVRALNEQVAHLQKQLATC